MGSFSAEHFECVQESHTVPKASIRRKANAITHLWVAQGLVVKRANQPPEPLAKATWPARHFRRMRFGTGVYQCWLGDLLLPPRADHGEP